MIQVVISAISKDGKVREVKKGVPQVAKVTALSFGIPIKRTISNEPSYKTALGIEGFGEAVDRDVVQEGEERPQGATRRFDVIAYEALITAREIFNRSNLGELTLDKPTQQRFVAETIQRINDNGVELDGESTDVQSAINDFIGHAFYAFRHSAVYFDVVEPTSSSSVE